MPTKRKEVNPERPRRFSRRWGLSFVGNIRHQVTARFGIALKRKRQFLGMTQADLAKATGLSRSYISEIEHGRESISLERAERLAMAVDSRLSELLKEE